MRIAFIGSHSTGKTTVAEPIAKALGLPFLSEVAREIVCGLIEAWGIKEKVYTVTSDTPEARITEILGVIDARKGH